ncbi:7-deoxyloganetin glucosyltransferase [Hibiscus syriacus]|uniref:7-deoxyloganetin glucosyltransferase n=1 Tax=Hibiscus syriacus TaxID=106335 RepID=A0A6A2XZG5_HIBSY|nr:7-deoxyloganetin glucosyltransferase [Hibiscus syriacus]
MVSQMHAVCIPYPAQGHVTPMLNLAKVLHHKGFHIIFVNTEYNHKRLLRARGPYSLDGLPDFRFETIPDGLRQSDNDNLDDGAITNVPRVTCIVTDDELSFPMEAAQELGVPCVALWTASTVSLVCYAHVPRLFEEGLTPVTNTAIEWMPGMKDICFKDLPSYVRTTDSNDGMLDVILKATSGHFKASAMIFNTFESLEEDALDTMSSIIDPFPVYSISPLHLLADQIEDNRLKHIDSNLWVEQSECVKWLDSKEPESVIYVNFGSMAVMSPHQLIEIAWGLANSKQPFLWIIRPNLVEGNAAILPPEFVVETKDRGLLASWCRQEEVLKHPSVGGFLSHMGWNSTIESISASVPMLCLPNFADQQTNTWLACTKLGIGMEIDEDVKRDQVEMLVRELLAGEKGIEMKAKAIELRRK